MTGQIRMTPDTMRQRSSEANDQANQMQELIKAMDRLLERLEGEWEGDAMRGYEDRYKKIRPSFENAKDLLDEISHNLSKTAQIIEDTDKNIGSQFRK